MVTHSSVLAWRIPWTEEPGGLQSMGLQRVRHDRATERADTLPSSFTLTPPPGHVSLYHKLYFPFLLVK